VATGTPEEVAGVPASYTGRFLADVLPGETVEERAVNGAKEYIKKNNLKNPSLTMLMIARFKNALPALTKQWEELTGVKMKFVEVSYVDSAAKIMAEAVAKAQADLDKWGSETTSFMGLEKPLFKLKNPGLVSIPLGFLAVILGSLLYRDKRAEEMWNEVYARQNTGLLVSKSTAH